MCPALAAVPELAVLSHQESTAWLVCENASMGVARWGLLLCVRRRACACDEGCHWGGGVTESC